jgi:hypothetical protein
MLELSRMMQPGFEEDIEALAVWAGKAHERAAAMLAAYTCLDESIESYYESERRATGFITGIDEHIDPDIATPGITEDGVTGGVITSTTGGSIGGTGDYDEDGGIMDDTGGDIHITTGGGTGATGSDDENGGGTDGTGGMGESGGTGGTGGTTITGGTLPPVGDIDEDYDEFETDGIIYNPGDGLVGTGYDGTLTGTVTGITAGVIGGAAAVTGLYDGFDDGFNGTVTFGAALTGRNNNDGEEDDLITVPGSDGIKGIIPGIGIIGGLAAAAGDNEDDIDNAKTKDGQSRFTTGLENAGGLTDSVSRSLNGEDKGEIESAVTGLTGTGGAANGITDGIGTGGAASGTMGLTGTGGAANGTTDSTGTEDEGHVTMNGTGTVDEGSASANGFETDGKETAADGAAGGITTGGDGTGDEYEERIVYGPVLPAGGSLFNLNDEEDDSSALTPIIGGASIFSAVAAGAALAMNGKADGGETDGSDAPQIIRAKQFGGIFAGDLSGEYILLATTLSLFFSGASVWASVNKTKRKPDDKFKIGYGVSAVVTGGAVQERS